MKTIAVFGASGNSGRYIVENLAIGGNKVIAVGRTKNNYFSKYDVEYYSGDIRNEDFINALPKTNIDSVINLAGVQPSILKYSEKTNFEKTMKEYLSVNVNGVFNIIEFCRKRGVKNYIYTTSHRDIEGHWVDGELLHSNLLPKINYKGDHVMYAITKTSGLMIGDYYKELFGLRVFNLRLPMIFSVPKKNWYFSNGEKKIIPFLTILRSASLGKTLEVWGDKNLKRDYVYKDNLTNIIEKCLSSNLDGGTFNVGTGESVTTENFIKEISNIFSPSGMKCEIIYKPQNKTYKHTSYDISDAKKLLGYSPVFLNEMLIKMKNEIDETNYFDNHSW